MAGALPTGVSPSSPEAGGEGPGLSVFQLLLMESIRSLEATLGVLAEWLSRSEARLAELQQGMERLERMLACRVEGPAAGAAQPSLVNLQRQLDRLEVQLDAGERRLESHEQFLTSRLLQRMAPDAFGAEVPPLAPLAPELPVPRLTEAERRPPAPPGGDYPSLQRDGQQFSRGSRQHPGDCQPCAFYCFSKQGCRKGALCEYCHMLHISRASRRRAKRQGTCPDQTAGRPL